MVGHKTLVVLWVLLTAFTVFLESRLPGTDVFLFKEAGTNLALKGKFVASYLLHMAPGEERPYAYYPPVYPLTFGIWSSVFGVGLRQSMLLESLLRAGRTILLLLFVLKLSGQSIKTAIKGVSFPLAFFLFVLSFISVDNDRPEDLAHIVGLLSWMALLPKITRERLFLSAVLLGLTASVSPAGAVLYGSVGLLVILANGRGWDPAIFSFSSLLTFFLVTLPVRLADPESYSRFSKQLRKSNFPFPFPWEESWANFWEGLSFTFKESYQAGGAFYFLAAVLAIGALAFAKRSRRNDSAWLSALLIASLAYIPIKIFVWTLQPYYFWFCAMSLIALLMYRYQSSRNPVILGLLFLSILPLVGREAKVQLQALVRDTAQSPRVIREKITSLTKPYSKIAVSHDAYFTLRLAREIADISWVCPYLERFDHVYLGRGSHTRIGETPPKNWACPKLYDCFEPTQDLRSSEPFSIFGMKTEHYLRDFGGVLYTRKECKAS